jgi:hypothetical protein
MEFYFLHSGFWKTVACMKFSGGCNAFSGSRRFRQARHVSLVILIGQVIYI